MINPSALLPFLQLNIIYDGRAVDLGNAHPVGLPISNALLPIRFKVASSRSLVSMILLRQRQPHSGERVCSQIERVQMSNRVLLSVSFLFMGTPVQRVHEILFTKHNVIPVQRVWQLSGAHRANCHSAEGRWDMMNSFYGKSADWFGYHGTIPLVNP